MATKHISQINLDNIDYQIKDANARNLITELDAKIQELESLKRDDYVYTAANQALTNKTYNGYTLKDAAGHGVDNTPTANSENLVKSGALYTKFTEINNELNEINNKKHALADDVDGEALRSQAVSISRPANILTAAGNMPLCTEQIFFNGSDGVSAGGPVDYILVNAKKGDNHRTILDCYDLQTGDHYINGCMRAETDSTATDANVWTGWRLQPSPSNTYTKTEVNNLIDQIPDSFTITPTLEGDDVINLTGAEGTNGFSLNAKHAKVNLPNGYTSGNSITSISGYGANQTIKIPQITVNDYGHVTAAADEEITITMPSAPTFSGDDIITFSTSSNANGVSYAASHAQNLSGGFTHGNLNTNFTIPYLTVDNYGHITNVETGQQFIITPSLPNTVYNGAICIVY